MVVPIVHVKFSWHCLGAATHLLCYSYGRSTATSLNKNLVNKRWGYAAICSEPEMIHSGTGSVMAYKTCTAIYLEMHNGRSLC